MKTSKKVPQLSMPTMKIAGGQSKKSDEETAIMVPHLKDRRTGKFIALNALDEAAGGRDKLVEVLEEAPKSARIEHLLNLLADPTRAMMKLENVCKDAGITYRELLSIYRDATMARAFAAANMAMAKRLERVAEDVADKATNHTEPCACTLNHTVDPDPECGKCKGQGLVFYRSSLPHQQMIFESTGLLKKGGGVNVQVNQQVAVGGGGIFEKFVKSTDAAAYGPKVAEGEVVDVPETRPDEG